MRSITARAPLKVVWAIGLVAMVALSLGLWLLDRRWSPKPENTPTSIKSVYTAKGLASYNVKKGGWSPRISPKYYEADAAPGRRVRLDGSDAKIVLWKSGTRINVPADVTFIEIGSTEQDIEVAGTPFIDGK